MNNDCYNESCPHRLNTTSSACACYRTNCQSRIGQAPSMLGALTSPPNTAFEDCLGCQHFPVCPEAEQKIAPCKHRLPHSTIDENKMRRVYQQVEEHGGIYHLIGLDQLSWEGRLLILPEDPEKRKQIWAAIECLGLYGEEGD